MAAKGTLFQVDTSPSKEVVVLGLTKNPFQIIDRTKAFEIRNEVLPVIRHLIET